ncbi:hypothetical protein PYW08_014008 [Mythimna loreyi]|uniref:Uncharacterized protein n=1 Tax=Mythimna loreyi TaxID=667449 RepID=A0ACC2R6P6_9NEOP|nr:hypothetical protein PYW08_014008 [Mythimna loreyi]
MSEYCRRRVMPSVFLGRQVVDAYSQILHFSQLELPYSCFLSIRTESGSNIILVIQLSSDKIVQSSCQKSRNQLLVYGIGETFGGYWGALPDNIMRPMAPKQPTDEDRYILKTTQPTTTTTTKRRTTPSTTPSTTTESSVKLTKPTTQSEYVVEFPIVNVSGVLVPGDMSNDFALFDAEESFNSAIDVKPKPGVSYKTTVLPLVQFAMSNQVTSRRGGEDDEAVAPRYEVDLGGDWFTPDARLSYPIFSLSTRSKPGAKYKYNMNHRLDFKKNKKMFAEKERMRSSLRKETQPASNPYGIVEAILKNLSKIKDEGPKVDMEIDKDVASLLQGLANIGHNESGFLVPNASWYTRRPASTTRRRISAKYRTDSITWRQPPASYRTNYLEEEDTSNEDESKSFSTMQAENSNGPVTIDVERSGPLLPPDLDVDTVILNATLPNINNIRKSKIVDSKTLASKVNHTMTTAVPTTLKTTKYLDDVEDTLTEEGLSAADDKSFNKVLGVNNNDPVIIDVERNGPLLSLDLDVDRVIFDVAQQTSNIEESTITDTQTLASEVSGTTTSPSTVETMKPTLVDHESWENMVQAASLMAVVLNQSVTPSGQEEKQGLNVTLPPQNNMKRHRKRYVHAIPIEFAKPHHLPVKVSVPSSTVHYDKIADAQEFQRLIELQDDEIHDRVALRYLRQYVGPALFNICAFDNVEAAAKYTILFNSSRLVLAITNFSLDGMSVVMTPARTLLRPDSRCSVEHLECQVLGARVCIDSLNACDGVANCGSYDVYDEDRLMCGASALMQHNVCLAAITFLAVLLTVLYTIHYWLKRWVPKVSDAFFIYTDAAENVLYLDPIMRSPHDTDDPKDVFRSAAMGYTPYMECTDIRIQEKRSSVFMRCCRFFRRKPKNEMSRMSSDPIVEAGYGQTEPGNQRFYSFAEVELRKIGTPFVNEVGVQTGPSLEMQFTDKPIMEERMTQLDSYSDIVAHYEGKRKPSNRRTVLDDADMIGKEPSEELSILHFFKRARSVSMQIPSAPSVQDKQSTNTEEKEIQCREYDHSHVSPESASVLATIGEISDVKPESEVVRKRIRFEETLRSKQNSEDDEVEAETATDSRLRRSVMYGGAKHGYSEDTEADNNIDEPSTSTGNREFKSYFWGGGKNKPKKHTTKKKKQQSTLR